MRFQDELLSLYPTAEPFTRQYLLYQVPRLPLHFDSDDLERLLERSRVDGDPRVGAVSAWAWDRVGADLALYAYGLHEDRLGLWSTLAVEAREKGTTGPDRNGTDEPGGRGRGGLGGQDERSEGPPMSKEAARLGRGACDAAEPAPGQSDELAFVLEPCAEPLRKLAERPGATGDCAREVLGLLPIGDSETVLRAGAHDPARALTALFSLARRNRGLAGQALAGERVLPLWIRTLAAGAIGGKEAFDVCWEAVQRGDERARWGAAMALPSLVEGDWRRLAVQLMKVEGGWVRVLVVDALGELAQRVPKHDQSARTDVLKILNAALKEAGHDLIRTTALRAMASVDHDLSRRRAIRCLERGSPLLKAAAVEALTRLRHDDQAYRKTLGSRMVDGPLKLRAMAVLGAMRLDPELALKGALALVRVKDPVARIEGGYALGYLQCQTALELLGLLARSDPFLPSALQAEKSLAHYPEEEATPILAPLLDHANPAVALGALRVLCHFPGESLSGLVPKLEGLERRLSGEELRTFLRQTGRLGPTVPGVSEFLARDRQDPSGMAGSLEGLARAGQIPATLASTAAASADARIGVTGALAQLLGGDRAGASTLARWLADDKAAAVALPAVRDLAIVSGEAGRGGRFKRLQVMLGVRKPSRVSALARPMLALRSGVVQPVRPRDSTEALKNATGTDRAGLVDEVSRALESPGSRPGAQTERLWVKQLTYVQETGLNVLAGARSLGWIPPSIRPYASLLIVPVLLAVPLLIVWVDCRRVVPAVEGGAGGKPTKLEPGAMRVTDLKGKASRTTGGKSPAQLALRDRVGPGDRVATEAGTRMMLADGAGNSLWLGESSQLRLGHPATEATTPAITQFVVVEPEGDVLLDFRKAKAAEVLAGQERIQGGMVTMRVLDAPSGKTLSVVSGEVDLVFAGRPARRLTPGQSVKLGAAR